MEYVLLGKSTVKYLNLGFMIVFGSTCYVIGRVDIYSFIIVFDLCATL